MMTVESTINTDEMHGLIAIIFCYFLGSHFLARMHDVASNENISLDRMSIKSHCVTLLMLPLPLSDPDAAGS